ncbi:GIY-YIG nuclease superfamily protein [Marinomonas gallaica]|uniref:GIY-YIG nuclease superfamily protein n=2 Tax=Oceanospirillaceae TaxID=135620 RepID=A0A1C3JQZ2_9GAMM|nr:GIY-YIG nuclease family protein [Marinomonas atlantica]SBT17460.1 GIY-YIG nuclease superfamily protein [Marinomonas gallaica]SBT19652.1 GIY-YIG nuclease superfamily protein [Marinomonas gallaica]
MSLPWYIYMIKTCQNTLYTGVTTDVERRFKEHQAGGSKGARFLKGKAPLTLVWYEQVCHKQLAMQLEYRVKRLSRTTKDKLVVGGTSITCIFPELFAQADVDKSDRASEMEGNIND